MINRFTYYTKRIFEIIYNLINFDYNLKKINSKIDSGLILQAKLISNFNNTNSNLIIENINLSEFKVFSQWGDDGIIQFLVNYLDIDNKRFIEFGVEDYKESNTRFLLINNNWEGLIFDSSDKNICKIKEDEIYWKYNITAKQAFITSENINELILESGFEGNIGLLHIDIDGNDYWIWKNIKVVNPIIVIMEYNSVFGNEKPWTIPYKSNFIRGKEHYSYLYYGTSLISLCDLAEEKGYYFIGCNSNGNNAYFVRKDKIKNLKILTCKEGYKKSQFRESRFKSGKLSFINSDERLKLLESLPIYNTRTNKLEKIIF